MAHTQYHQYREGESVVPQSLATSAETVLSRTLRALALPLLFALVLLTALIGVVTERAFRPVQRIAADRAARGVDDLSVVNTAEMPVETHALGVGLPACSN